MELQLKSFALEPLIANVVKTIEPLAAKNGNQIALRHDPAIGTLHADQMWLRQALLNLMSNANKFTDHGTAPSPSTRLDRGDRHWHRHDGGADGQVVPGILPGFVRHGEQVRWHRPGPRDQ